MEEKEQQIIAFLKENGACSSKEVHDNVSISVSYATLKRLLSKLIANNYIISIGNGKGTKYNISPTFELLAPIDIEKYYEKEIDDRVIKENFNFSIMDSFEASHSQLASKASLADWSSIATLRNLCFREKERGKAQNISRKLGPF